MAKRLLASMRTRQNLSELIEGRLSSSAGRSELVELAARMIERRIKAAKFPAVKSLESFDFEVIPSLNKKRVLDLARVEFVGRHENVIALGPSGAVKIHIATAIGLAACQRGIKVRFATAAAIVHELIEARDDKRLLRLQKTLAIQRTSHHRRARLRATLQVRRRAPLRTDQPAL